MKTTIIILTLFTVSLLAFGQENVLFLKNWNTYPIPENIMGYNSADKEWVVYLDSNEVRAVNDRSYTYRRNFANKKLPFEIEQLGVSDVIQVTDGYLVAFDRGEWGGGLFWYSKNGKKNDEIVNSMFSSPVVQFVKRDNRIYAITGLAHLGMSFGNIIEIKREREKWILEEFVKLPDAPNTIQLDSKDNMLVFTCSGLYSIDREANLDTLAIKIRRPIVPIIEIELPNDTLRIEKTPIKRYPNWEWGFLYPNSMVIQNDVVYVGMRGGVYKFDLATKKEEWLMPE
ncbi:MAG: hypothetical protein LBE91_20305 [Tannerella sp.]|jgi:hypothetical protein|nr:hypothetical protein [Tannerella sp.]